MNTLINTDSVWPSFDNMTSAKEFRSQSNKRRGEETEEIVVKIAFRFSKITFK